MASSGAPGVYFCFRGLNRAFADHTCIGNESIVPCYNKGHFWDYLEAELRVRKDETDQDFKDIRLNDIVQLKGRRHFYQFS